MCGRYRLSKRRLLEIDQYSDIDELADVEVWKREYNTPSREMAPAVLPSPKPALIESQGLRGKERLATTLAWSEVLRDQNEIFDHRLVLDMGFVFDRAPTLALVLGHVGPTLGSAG